MRFDLNERDNQMFVVTMFVLGIGFLLVAFGLDGEIKALMGTALGHFLGRLSKRG